ncbi:MAG: PAS domain S-box protein [Burkholderiaceae bacterium]
MDQPRPRIDEQTIFRSLFAAYPDALLLVDERGLIRLANPAARDLFGYELEELLALSVDELVPDAIRPRHAAYRSAYAEAPRARPMGTQMELVARRRNGSEVMVEIALSPLQGQGLPYVVAAIRGIGAYPRVKQALQRARYSDQVAQFGRHAVDTRDQKRLVQEAPRVAAEALHVPHAMVYLLDADQLNFRVASGVGLVAQQGIGARVPNDPNGLPGRVVAGGRNFVVADTEQTHGFAISPWYVDAGLMSALAVPLSDRGRAIGVLAVRSTVDQRFGDEEVRFLESLASLLATSLQRAQSDEALSHAQRLESVGQLTGGIAHDFNNLLTVISGNLQVVHDMPPLPDHPAIQQMIGSAARAASRAADLTEKLLAFSRRQVLQPSTVDVHRMLNSLADMLRRTLDQRIGIEVDVAPDCPACLADRTQLESALLNVAINARDAMPNGGTLRFTGEAVDGLPSDAGGPRAQTHDSGYIAMSVIDSGAGMADSVMERAFEPFFTTKEAGRGTGLGLSTVYGFATQSGGAVALRSALGKGTTITIYLPRPSQPQQTEEQVANFSQIPAGLKVLMVEDDAEVRAVVQTFLTALGCEAVACATAEQAAALLAQGGDKPSFDLLLTDIALGPDRRGTELAREAHQRWPRMPILLMSGFSSDLLEAPPAWPLLRKPYSREALGQAIAQALQ